MLYHYKALSRAGASLSGEMEAVSRATVLEDLHQLGHFPIEVTELNRAAGGGARVGDLAQPTRDRTVASRARTRAMERG